MVYLYRSEDAAVVQRVLGDVKVFLSEEAREETKRLAELLDVQEGIKRNLQAFTEADAKEVHDNIDATRIRVAQMKQLIAHFGSRFA